MNQKTCDDSPAERGDGNDERRAAVYGLKPDQLFDHTLIVPANQHMRLSGERVKEDHPALRRLHPKSIDDVKRWIGVPDELGARRACSCKLPAAVPGAESASDLRRGDPKALRAAYEVAHEYVHGDSRRVAAYKPFLDKLVDRSWISIILLRPDIDIYNGAVLEVGSDIKVLFARHIRIWKGGLLKIRGDVKIDCVSITGNYHGIVQAFDAALFGRLLRREELP